MPTFFVQGLPQYAIGAEPLADQVWLLRNVGMPLADSNNLSPRIRRLLIKDISSDMHESGNTPASMASLIREFRALGVANLSVE